MINIYGLTHDTNSYVQCTKLDCWCGGIPAATIASCESESKPADLDPLHLEEILINMNPPSWYKFLLFFLPWIQAKLGSLLYLMVGYHINMVVLS